MLFLYVGRKILTDEQHIYAVKKDGGNLTVHFENIEPKDSSKYSGSIGFVPQTE